jgi:DNA polymerase III gamma/tau subunit
MPLHIDLRPTTFDEVVGNDAILTSLQNELQKSTKAHCYMFSGASGTGKSTLMGICAKQLGATELDIHEFNIGDARGIDSAREIIDTMNSYPYGDATVIMLEEVHNSTKAFQEALLRPFENPPDHVYIFMATTAPSKIITTLRRRFMEFKLQPIVADAMYLHLLKLAKQLDVSVQATVLDKIVEKAEGSLGRALIHFDKIRNVDASMQLAVIDESENATKTVIDLCQALLYGKGWKSIIPIVECLDDNPESYRHVIINYMMKVLLNPKSSKNHLTAGNIIDIFDTYNDSKAVFVKRCYECTME